VHTESTETAGAAIRAKPRIGKATTAAMRSARVSAKRLGTSSPKIKVIKVISATAIPRPTGSAHGLSAGMNSRMVAAMLAPIASPPNTPVSTPIRVMPTCTVDRKCSGCCDSS
jgi:hypothetical protein